MPDSKQMNPVLVRVERVNDSLVAHARPKTVRSFQPMMRKRFEAQSDFIDFRFDPCTESGWQLDENGIETWVVNLSRRTHGPLVIRAPALMPATLAALPPTRVAPAHACSAHGHARLFQRPCRVPTAESSLRTLG